MRYPIECKDCGHLTSSHDWPNPDGCVIKGCGCLWNGPDDSAYVIPKRDIKSNLKALIKSVARRKG